MESDIFGELLSLDLGDRRLNQRGQKLLGTLFANPEASVNAACHGWAETQAAYRFFDSDLVTDEPILAAHRAATRNRMAAQPVVLLVQDTTELDYSEHPPAGAGPLNSLAQRGFLDHTQLALTPDGLCLGVTEVEFWARDDATFGTSHKREHDPFETKEKVRWRTGYQQACAWARDLTETRIISVADSEADIYEVLLEAERQGPVRAEFVIRSGRERTLSPDDPAAAEHHLLREAMSVAPLVAVRELTLPRTPKREKRGAVLEVRARRVRLKSPRRKQGPLPELEINVVLVTERDPPAGVEPIEWMLLTTLPIETPDDALRVIDYYTGRWPIEVFFRIFKTGCRVERIQLETAARLRPCLMLYKIVAWRVQYLTMLGRECPDLPADVLFTADEWKSVWTIVKKKPVPKRAPPLSEFLLLLGALGGHNGRRRDPPPGPQALWTGIRRMTDFATAWRAFGPADEGQNDDVCN